MGPFLDRIKEILSPDGDLSKKQRHTAKRIHERLVEEGYEGSYSQIKEVVRDLKRQGQEVFVPLIHRPGEAQVDLGYALANLKGELRKVPFFVMSLPYSDGFRLKAFDRGCTETFWEGHLGVIEFFYAVPRRITSDNSRVMVSSILKGRDRKMTEGFVRLKSHYLFDHHFCQVRRGNEEGVVDGTVKFARRNFLVPVPQVWDMRGLNELLEACCRRDLGRFLRGKEKTKEGFLEEERKVFHPISEVPFEACRKV